MRRGPLLVSAVLAVLMLAPALRPGYVLSYDMVFVPHPDLTRGTVGLGDGLPRAVPVDAVVALLGTVIPGSLLQKLALVLLLVAAGTGAGRLAALLVPGPGADAAGLVTAGLYVWNPYLAERLVLGHWALLVAYASMPWLVMAAQRARSGRPRALAQVVLLLGLTALTPTGGLLGGGLAIAVLAGRWRPAAVVAAAWLALNAPWWGAALLHGASPAGATSSGVDVFASRSEAGTGTLVTLLGLGGAWNAQVVPDSRESVLGLLWTAVALGLAVIGGRRLHRSPQRAVVRGLTITAVSGLLLALLGVLPGTGDLLGWAVEHLQAAGLLRDGQKWVAPWALLLSVAAGAGASTLAGRVRDPSARRLIPLAALVVLVALLPDLAWGAAGRLDAVGYPAGWARARAAVEAADAGDVMVLPWGAFRSFRWNGGRTVLDPAGRYFPGSVVTDDTLVVGNRRVPGESRRAATARAALDRPDAGARLRALGIGWILVHRQPEARSPAERGTGAVPAGTTTYADRELRLVRLHGPVASRPLPSATVPVLAGDVAAALVLLGAAGFLAARPNRRRAGIPLGTVRRSRGSDDPERA
jgi:hypothetical protein